MARYATPQGGFSLIETVVALLIRALIVPSLAGAIFITIASERLEGSRTTDSQLLLSRPTRSRSIHSSPRARRTASSGVTLLSDSASPTLSGIPGPGQPTPYPMQTVTITVTPGTGSSAGGLW